MLTVKGCIAAFDSLDRKRVPGLERGCGGGVKFHPFHPPPLAAPMASIKVFRTDLGIEFN